MKEWEIQKYKYSDYSQKETIISITISNFLLESFAEANYYFDVHLTDVSQLNELIF